MRAATSVMVLAGFGACLGCASIQSDGPRSAASASEGGFVVKSPTLMNSNFERPNIGEVPVGGHAAYGNPALRPDGSYLAVVGVETNDVGGWVGGAGLCVPGSPTGRPTGGAPELDRQRDLLAGVWVKFDF